MRRGPEAKIQDAVKKYAETKYKALVKKNEVGRYGASPGWPDITVFAKDGWAFFIEFKRAGGRLTPLQEHWCKQIEKRGFNVYVVSSVEHGKSIIDLECS